MTNDYPHLRVHLWIVPDSHVVSVDPCAAQYRRLLPRKSDCRTNGIESHHFGAHAGNPNELAGAYDQQRRFVTPKPSDEQVVFSACELAEYRETSDRIARLNDELMPALP
jgi:hypothetical protein